MSSEEEPNLSIVREPINVEDGIIEDFSADADAEDGMISVTQPTQPTQSKQPIETQIQPFGETSTSSQPDPIETQIQPFGETSTSSQLDHIKAALFRTLKGTKVYFTSKGRNDGVGAQALAKITVMVMSKALDMPYVHMPFKHLEHADEGVKFARFAEEWEKLLDIGGKSKHLTKFQQSSHIKNEDLFRMLRTFPFKPGNVYVTRDAHSFTNALRNELHDPWQSTIEELRIRYQGRRSLNTTTTTIAIHIRRGDALARGGKESEKRTFENSYFASIMKQLECCATEAGVKVAFHVISEGTPGDFADLTSQFPNLELHLSTPSSNINHRAGLTPRQRNMSRVPRNQHLLNRRMTGAAMEKMKQMRARRDGITSDAAATITAAEAFQLLVSADVLVMSKSAFSYLAGLYSNGIKVFPPQMWWDMPQWCEDHDAWFRVEETNIIDVDALKTEFVTRYSH